MLRHAPGGGIKHFPAEQGSYASLVRTRQGMVLADIGAEQGAPGSGDGVVRQGCSPQIHGGAVSGQPFGGIRRKGRAKALALPGRFRAEQGALSQQGRQHWTGKLVAGRIITTGGQKVQFVLRLACEQF